MLPGTLRPLARPKAEPPSRLRTGARASPLRMRAGVQQLYQFDEKRRSLELEEIKLAMCRGIFQVDPVTVLWRRRVKPRSFLDRGRDPDIREQAKSASLKARLEKVRHAP